MPTRLTRRDFLELTSAGAVAAGGSLKSGVRSLKAATLQPSAFSLQTADFRLQTSLFDRPMRWVQLTLVENDPGRFDPQFWLDYFKRLHADAATLSGRLVAGGRIALRPGSPEIETWTALVADRLHGGDGVPVLAVGARLSFPGAERAEITNLAARHIYTLRGRLVDQDAITTARHAYRLAPHLRVGVATSRVPDATRRKE